MGWEVVWDDTGACGGEVGRLGDGNGLVVAENDAGGVNCGSSGDGDGEGGGG